MTDDDQKKRIPEDWYASAFGELYPVIYAHRTVAAARPEARFAMAQTGLAGRDRALDLCCGNGRHMAALREETAHLAGLDYSPDLLRIAADTLEKDAALVRGDMRALPFADAAFDVLFNFFTSFGYFRDHEENRAVVHEAARVLRPAGRFFIDYINPVQVAASLTPRTERSAGGLTILETRWIDAETRRVNKSIRVTRDSDVLLETGESVRLYTLAEMEALLSAAGLEISAVFGDYEGTAYSEETPRMILTGARKELNA
jgi:SAM-dependent methyltransferase